MSAVFISYSHSDEEAVAVITNQLAENKFDVWQDQKKLRGGESWPKRVGEAIRDSDAFILFWSKSASMSDYVELEWSTALALKKVIIPFFLDDTTLPAALAAIQGVHGIEGLAKALSSPTPKENRADQNKVIEELDEPSLSEPKEVLRAVSKIIKNRGLHVEGNLRNDGTIIINYNEDSGKNRLLQKIAMWVTIIAGAVAILSFGIDRLENGNDTINEDKRKEIENLRSAVSEVTNELRGFQDFTKGSKYAPPEEWAQYGHFEDTVDKYLSYLDEKSKEALWGLDIAVDTMHRMWLLADGQCEVITAMDCIVELDDIYEYRRQIEKMNGHINIFEKANLEPEYFLTWLAENSDHVNNPWDPYQELVKYQAERFRESVNARIQDLSE